jgi:1-acyl-sn-glycerol-3-phosphate acyltransferase
LDPAQTLSAALRALGLGLWTVLLLPVQILAVATGSRLARVVPALYHRGNCRLVGLEVKRSGAPPAPPPTLFVANHASYLDIVVLSTLLDASFVAKAEVAGWPLFGLLARLVNSVFVERRPSRAGAHRNEIRRLLESGRSLILFPEGTSSDGNRVLPFNSTFFGVAEAPVNGWPVAVQPISIAYTRCNDLPMSRRERPYLAWYGDMDLAGHLWQLLCRGPATVEVRFHAPIDADAFASRKALAVACQRKVAEGVSGLLGGRPPRSVAPAALPQRA